MRKLLLIIVLLYICISIFAAPGDSISIGLASYDAGRNVDMKSMDFPVRGNTISYNKNASLTDPQQYRNEHIVAGGGIYGIPLNGFGFSDGTYIRYDNIAPLVVEAQCPTDFRYVSQSHTEFQRPFRLYVVARSGVGDSPTNIPGTTHAGNSAEELSDKKIRSYVEFESTSNGSYMNMWFDLLLGLPYDQNGINSTGVIIDKVVYPLIASDDYTASVTITISWEQPYDIVDGSGNIIRSDTFRYRRSLIIPFSGYVDRYSTSDSTINLNITRLYGASNINLNDGYTGLNHATDIATIDMLANFNKTAAGSISENRDKVRIFMSSNPNAKEQGSEFTLLHEDARGVVEENNSFNYRVLVSTTDGEPQTVEFDGTDYLSGSQILNNFLSTDCHAEDSLYQVDTNVFHFHTFNGIVSIVVEDRNNTNVPMLAGRYTSRIYVHVVVDN